MLYCLRLTFVTLSSRFKENAYQENHGINIQYYPRAKSCMGLTPKFAHKVANIMKVNLFCNLKTVAKFPTKLANIRLTIDCVINTSNQIIYQGS